MKNILGKIKSKLWKKEIKALISIVLLQQEQSMFCVSSWNSFHTKPINFAPCTDLYCQTYQLQITQTELFAEYFIICYSINKKIN